MAQSEATASLGWQDFFTTTLDGSITDTDTTISLANAPTPTEGFLVIEPDSSTNREIIMYTSVSGNDVVCGSVDDRGIGGTTARAHSSGAIVKMNTVSDMFEALQSGKALSTGAITTAKLADDSVTPAKLVAGTGSTWAWESWTPTWTNLSAGTLTYAKYKKIGNTVHFRLKQTLNGANIAGAVSFTLPVSLHANYSANDSINANVHYVDANGSQYPGTHIINASGGITILAINAAGTYAVINNISATVPFTWASGDTIDVNGSYEAA